ncbi:Uncharacterized membrane protein [Roseivivax lentus]|uniref:Uncharacterized membrane protein n=1 Tax=Roseivivax lentus TaxID=633194 RepID=A0A1N7NN47_9RHOB|nr:DUF2189 domain-containing protein [Roseivivax lentus]SIS99638.1 Uncharacterized membrane protein [Roseivivax lentus]
MVKTIGNPLSWTMHRLAGAAGHVSHSVEGIGGVEEVTPEVQALTLEDLRHALRQGWADFGAARTDVMFICLVYPVVGVLLAAIGFNMNMLPILFPVAAGFALLGPLAAVGLYEVSRQRETGQPVSWLVALHVVRSPNFGAILVLGLYLAVLFLAWLLVAHLIWLVTLGPVPPETLTGFAAAVLTTGAGWAMIVLGMAVGCLFALAVLITGAISFPLLLDHNIGVPAAIATSYRVFRRNPRTMIVWGALVAALLVLGSIPAFIGLVIVLPLLGHATWHLYRRAVTF